MTDFTKNGKPWTKEEEESLLKEYAEQELTLLDLVINHKRKPTGIFGRLKKLGLIKFPTEVRGYNEYTNSDIYKQLKKKKEKEEIEELAKIENISLEDVSTITETRDTVKKILSILEKVYRV